MGFKKSRALAAFVLALAIGISSFAPAVAASYTPGTYTGTARGFGGVVSVEITVSADSITNVVIKGDSETTGIGTLAIDKMPEKIKAANGGAVDTVSGATITSKAIQEATDAALKQAAGGGSPAVSGVNFKPGTYSGTAKGYNGDVVLKVTFSDSAITDIEVEKSAETAHVGTSAYDIMFADIKEFVSTGVDTVSGATFTSRAVLEAVEDAAAQAGCDAAALRKGAKAFARTPGQKITDTYDVVVVGAGGAGMAAAATAAQAGSTVIVIEKMAEMGGNTLVAGGSYQSPESSLTWDQNDPEATEGIAPNGKTVVKNKMELGRLDTLKTILNWKETPFDGKADPSKIKSVDDYELHERGVHAEYLPTLLTLKDQIRAYLAYAEPKLAAGKAETELTLFSTVELHIFQTYYGGLRLNADKTKWIVNDFELVSQMCNGAREVKPWLADQGTLFDYETNGTLIGCLWQRINRVLGGEVDGVSYSGAENKWGAYFKVPENTILKANPKNKVMTRTTVESLIQDSNGRVTGVKGVQFDGTEVEIMATKGVILATGGYGANIKMVLDTNEYWSTEHLTSAIGTTNRSLAQGEGITMAQSIGAAVTGMGWTQLMPLGWVDNGNLAGGSGENVIYISPAGTPNAGKRYVNEAAERDVLSQAAYDFGGEKGQYIELGNWGTTAGMGGATQGPKSSADNVEGRVYYCTISEAAELIEIDEARLRETITEYDAYIIGASETPSLPAKTAYSDIVGECEKDSNGAYLPETYKLEKVKVRFMAPSTHHTMGGLVVDTDRRVLTEDNKAIAGLFAAGEVTGGVFAGNRLGGNAIVEIIVSGRIAGNSVANGK